METKRNSELVTVLIIINIGDGIEVSRPFKLKKVKNKILLLLIVLIGCNTKPTEKPYPRFVKNKCTGMFAIQTGYGDPDAPIVSCIWVRGYEHKDQILYFGQQTILLMAGENPKIDSKKMPLGYEYTYPDSATAVRAWHIANYDDSIKIVDERIRRDSVSRQKAIDDSIFACQHSYN